MFEPGFRDGISIEVTGLVKFFMLSALLVPAMGGGAAWAQYGLCFVSTDPATVRAEGVSEIVGTFTLRCDSLGDDIATGAEIEVVLSIEDGIAITNRVSGDDMAVGSELTVSDADGALAADAVSGTGAGEAITGNTLRWMLTIESAAALSAGDTLAITISGIRVNASASVGTIRASGEFGGVPVVNGGAKTIARTSKGIGSVELKDAVAGLQCAKADAEAIVLEVKEGFASAFQTNNEHNGDIFLMVALDDIPGGVTVEADIAVHCANPGFDPDDAENTAPVDYAVLKWVRDRGGNGVVDFMTDQVDDNGAKDDDGRAEVELTAGAGHILYNIAHDTAENSAVCEIPVYFSWDYDPESDKKAALGSGSVSVSFAPLSSIVTAHESAPVPRFAATGDSMTAVTIEICSTTLLFPFVTNRFGFDTGITITNTSQDTFGTPPQEGSCEINYYGSTAVSGAAPSAQTSTLVAAGSQLIFTLSSGGGPLLSLAGAPEFRGYIMAVCDFQYAHGIALITNGFGGIPSLMHGYSALVVPRDAGGEGRGGAVGGESLSH